MTRIVWSRRSSFVLSVKCLRVGAFLLVPLALTVIALGLAPVQASPQTAIFDVNSTMDEPDATPGDGACASTPSGLCTLRAAVQEANALVGGDTIVVPAGIYTLTLSGRGEELAATGDLDILEDVTVQGSGASVTVIDANAIDRAFQIFHPAQVTLSSLAIQGGDSATASGGGIALASGSSLTLEDAVLEENRAGSSGGGLYNNGGTLLLWRVEVLANNATTAAGIHNGGSLSAYDSTIANNKASQTAGGLFNSGSLTLDGVTVSGNIADTNGGGLYLHSADPATGLATITNSTISGNQAKAYMGGGIWIYYQTELWLSSSTVANNTAGQGGGIFNYHQQGAAWPMNERLLGDGAQEGNLHLHNTIVANNLFANCGRSAQTFIIHSLGHNLDSGDTCEFLPTLGDLENINPQLGLLQDNGGPTWTHALLPGSPAIDAGDNADCPATDQRGVSRPQGGACDIGAYESIPSGEANLGITKRDDPDPVEPGAGLTYTLSVSNAGPDAAMAITVTDELPAGVAYSSAMGSGWSCGHAAGMVTCTRPSLAVGTAPEITLALLAPASPGTITNTATVTSTVADPSPGNNLAREQTLVQAPPLAQADLSIAKVDDPDPVEPGAGLTYTLSVSNAGPDAATAITVTDELPAGVIYSSATGSGWSCGHAAGMVTCTRPSLAVGAAPEITLALLAPASPGTITNTATVTSTVTDPSPGNNLARISTQVTPVHHVYLPLAVRQTAPASLLWRVP